MSGMRSYNQAFWQLDRQALPVSARRSLQACLVASIVVGLLLCEVETSQPAQEQDRVTAHQQPHPYNRNIPDMLSRQCCVGYLLRCLFIQPSWYPLIVVLVLLCCLAFYHSCPFSCILFFFSESEFTRNHNE